MGEKPRLTVNAREAVRLFRSGMSDVDLMRRYNISARSLERLFKKLVDEGEITKAELNRRLYGSDRSHIVDVVAESDLKRTKSKRKIRISASDVLSRLRSGMSDIELMDQYNLSARGLDRLFRRLVKRGDIAEEYLDERKRAFHWADIAFVNREGQSPESLDDEEFDAEPDHTAFREFLEEHKVVVSALLGALCGMLVTVVFLVSLVGFEKTRNLLWGPDKTVSPSDDSLDPLDSAARRMISTLESIARGDTPTGTDKENRSPEYDQCLKDCDTEYRGGDAADKVLWVNCRKSCVVRYSKRLKEIRKLYHGRPLW